MGKRDGFTLIEIIVVMMIAAVLTAGTASLYRTLVAGISLQTAGDRLVQEIRNTEQSALAENSSEYYYFIQFYPEEIGEYKIKRSANPAPLVVSSIRLPGSVALAGTNFSSQALSFSNRGIPTKGGTITLRNRLNGKFRFVIVASITGRVRVSDQPPQSWETD